MRHLPCESGDPRHAPAHRIQLRRPRRQALPHANVRGPSARRIASPNRRWRAFLLCRREAERFVASLTVTDRAGKALAHVEAFQAGPSEFQFVPQFGIVKWVAPTRVAMLNRRGEEVVALDVE